MLPNPWDTIDINYPVGKHLKRSVKKLTNSGAFIELEEGIDGFLHVEDMCRSVIHAYDHEVMIGEAYNIADDTHITSAEFYSMVSLELLGEEKDFFHLPITVARPIAVASQLIARIFKPKPSLEKATLDYVNFDKHWDNSKLKATKFEFKYPTIEKGLKETLSWYKDSGWFAV